MSVEALTWANNVVTGSPTRKSVLRAVANFADENHKCWPSHKKLAEHTELSVPTVARALKDLEESGLIERQRRHRRTDGSRTSDLITLTITEPTRQRAYKADTLEPNHHSDGARIGKPILEPSVEPSETHARDELAEAVQSWNEFADESGLPKIQKLTKAREAALRARLEDCGGVDGWRLALNKIRGSPGLLGKSGGWRANFDFLVRESNFVKLMEGNYDNWHSGKTKRSRLDEWRNGFSASS